LSSQSEVKVEKIPWVPIVLLTFIIGIFGYFYAAIQPNATWYAPGYIACMLLLTPLPLFLIIGASIAGKLVGKPISATNYTYLYATGMSLVLAASSNSFPVGNLPNHLFDRVTLAPEVDPWPPFMAPTAEVIRPMVTGGAAVPWVDWVPTIAWWWLLTVGFAFFNLGWGVIWRRRWIDVEKVPFPHTRVAVGLVERVTSTERSLKTRLGLPFVVGLVLGIAFQVPLLLAYMFPWFPDIYGWRVNTCSMGAQYITSDSPLAGIVGLAQLNKDPAVGAIFYLAPLNILFGAWFWYLIFAILMQVAFTMGYYTGITDYSGCGRVWCGTTGYRVGEPFKWNVFSSAGVATGIFIGYIIMNWRYLAETFNAAIGKIGKDKLMEFDRTEPTSYRNAYLMIGGSTVLLIALIMMNEVGFPAALLLIITNVITSLVGARAYSLVGFVVPEGTSYYYGPMKVLLNGGANPNSEWFVAMGLSQSISCEPITASVSFPLVSSLASYQMASVNKVSVKSVLKIMLFISILAPLLSLIGAIWGFYTFGTTKMPWIAGVWYSKYEGVTPDAIARWPAHEPWWPQMIAGIAFAGILSFLHARFVWFPLEPIGFLLATDGHALIEGIWTMTLAAWVLKTITLRVGGSKLYERTGIPAAIGFIIGLIVITIVGGAILFIRFLHPF
jgi:hypothetical protein